MALQYYELPLTPIPQTFSMFMNGVVWNITLRWSPISELWIIDFADSKGAPVLMGVPVVGGLDLLGQHQHLNFGGSLVAQTDNAPLDPPTFNNLGVTSHLFFIFDDGT